MTRKAIILLVLGLVIGIGGTLYLVADRVTQATAIKVSPVAIRNNAEQAERQTQGKIDSLVITNISLIQKAGNTTAALQRAKKENDILVEMVDTLIARTQTTDTAVRLAQCDSLTQTVQDLILSESLKDNLYEDLTTNLQLQVSNKDSIIDFQQQQYNCLKVFFNQSLTEQQALSTENLRLEKQLKRRKVGNKLLSAGIAIVSGCTVYTLFHH